MEILVDTETATLRQARINENVNVIQAGFQAVWGA
jgi:hypothetical protein